MKQITKPELRFGVACFCGGILFMSWMGAGWEGLVWAVAIMVTIYGLFVAICWISDKAA